MSWRFADENTMIVDTWAAMSGRWHFTQSKAVYLGPLESQSAHLPFGLALGKARLRSGRISGIVGLGENAQDCNGRIIVGYNSETRGYFAAGIGGYGFAYVLDEFIEPRGWRALAVAGTKENLLPNSPFAIEAHVRGQRMSLTVNGIQVIVHTLPKPLEGDQVGLLTWGQGPVEFTDVMIAARKPEVFVVMQFSEPYNSIYTEVIKPAVDELNHMAYRADEVYKPGIILQDIIGGIVEAEVVIAEITAPNQAGGSLCNDRDDAGGHLLPGAWRLQRRFRRCATAGCGRADR
jgi:hypothetical protein